MTLIHAIEANWTVVLSVIAAIVYIVRIEMGLRAMSKEFEACRRANGTLMREGLENKIDALGVLLRDKIDGLLADTAHIAGKLEIIERHINGGGK